MIRELLGPILFVGVVTVALVVFERATRPPDLTKRDEGDV